MAGRAFDQDLELTAVAALAASGHAFTVADARDPDFPLIWVNPAFEELTGYRLDDVRGHNCRFLQGDDSDPATVARIRQALLDKVPITETLLNYRPDGSSWWNQVTITPVLDADGQVTHFVGVQHDADDRVAASRQRDAARLATSDAESALHAAGQARAIALQASLLPTLPQIPGLELAARYLPASDTDAIGGDWYDVLALPDGGTGIAIGDVMGHDMYAAGAMGQLRSVLRSYAWEGQAPAEVLDRLNQLVCGLGMARLATCVYARIEPATSSGQHMLHWSNAGHLPPLLRTPDAEVTVLDDGAGLLIGVLARSAAQRRASATRALPPGSTLLFYTDGLVEHRDRDIETGISILQTALRDADQFSDLELLLDRITAVAGDSEHLDDQCLLAVRVR